MSACFFFYFAPLMAVSFFFFTASFTKVADQ